MIVDKDGRLLREGSVVLFGKALRKRGVITTVRHTWARVRADNGRACTVRPYRVKRVA